MTAWRYALPRSACCGPRRGGFRSWPWWTTCSGSTRRPGKCIEYIARRAGGRLAVVLAARDSWYPPERIRLPDLPVGPVDDCAAAELLRQRAPELAPPVAAAIAQAAAGNPLALVELPATLTASQRAGRRGARAPARTG